MSKILVNLTCVTILAAGLHYAWKEYTTHQYRTARTERMLCRAALGERNASQETINRCIAKSYIGADDLAYYRARREILQ